jgi:hypothetical protein
MSSDLKLSFDLISHDDTLFIRAVSPLGEANNECAISLTLDSVLLKLKNESLTKIPDKK